MKHKAILKDIVRQSLIIVMVAVVLGVGVNAIRSDGIPLVADWSPAARLQAATGKDDLIIPMAQAIAFHETQAALFVDARSPEDYTQGHIAGAINIPWEMVYDYLEQLFQVVVDHDAIIVVYCDGESCPLSEELVLLLRDLGYPNARVLVNGWSLWKNNGYPVAAKTSVPQST